MKRFGVGEEEGHLNLNTQRETRTMESFIW